MSPHFDPTRCSAGAQHHRHGPAPLGIEDVNRQKAALVIVCIEQRQLLMAVHHVAGIVDVEGDGGGLARVAVHPGVHERIGQPDHVPQTRRVLEPR